MANIAIVKPGGLPPIRLSGRAISALAAIIGLLFVVVAGFVLANAWFARQGILDQAVSDAASTSDDVDQLVETMRDLLLTLSTSPAFKSGDLEAFHLQLTEIPKPEGVWIVYWDEERQLLNSARPYGSALPLVSEFSTGRAVYETLRGGDRGFLVRERLRGKVIAEDVVPLHLRVRGADGRMAGVLTAMLSAPQLHSVIDRQRLPSGWRAALLDRRAQPLTGREDAAAIPDGPTLFGRAIVKSAEAPQGLFVAEPAGGPALVIAFHRSSLSDFTSLVVMPLADSFAPLRRALAQVGLAALALLLGGALVFLIVSKEAVAPIERMSARVQESESDLFRKNVQLNAVLAGISDCYVMLDHDFRIIAGSETAFDWFSLDPEQAIGVSFWDVVAYDDEASGLLRQCVRERRAMHRELPSRLRSGRFIDFRMYPSAHGSSIFFRDITVRRNAVVELEETRELLQASLDAVASPLVIVDAEGAVAYSNRAWHRFETRSDGGPADPVCLRSRANAIIGGADPRLAVAIDKALRGESLRAGLIFSRRGRRFHLRAAPFSVEGRRHAVVLLEDVTEIAAARDEIRELSHALLTLQESERRQIAEELHDSTAQHLVAVSLNLMRLGELARAPEAKPVLREIEGSVDEALKQIRSVSYLLHPPNLECDGLEGALRSFADGFSRRTGLVTDLRFDADAGGLDFDAQRSLLRVVQEALMNVHRHAGASRVRIRAREREGWLEISILDDGVGITATPRRHGVGIPGMQSRLRQSGGSLQIRCGRRGTLVVARVPLAGAPDLQALANSG